MSKSDKIVVVNNGGASSVFWGLFLFFIVFPCVTVLGCFACTGTFLAMNVPKAKDSENQSPKSIEPRARLRQVRPVKFVKLLKFRQHGRRRNLTAH